ncbi:SusC/RagA family TonB-linked outer membrane protein [Dysgonomonas termitidis]|uniref:SusC/RagA family TonB-linked outer membrane protein n=1 Tax=Dysgonomonas termitidis TaxID=1516126 RepID=A0ABV9KZY7_9BACT
MRKTLAKKKTLLGTILCLLLICATGITNVANAQSKSTNSETQKGVISVSGKVVDETGEALIGVSVVIEGTTQGTITDVDGNYSINVKQGQSLKFSYVGYTALTVKADKERINVEMQSAGHALDEMIVIGYGVQKKKLITGATIQVNGDDILRRNTVNAIGALQGQTPGVNIIKSNGKPGEGFKITVRGLGTVGNSTPLYIVDGIIGADINTLNAADIESIDVLKDAASAAIYGARAANGVILVTTKQGKAGKTQISYDGYVGWQNIYKKPGMLNAKEYAMIMNEARMNDKLTPYDFSTLVPDWDRIERGEWQGTDWFGEMLNKDALTQNHAINVTGGTDRSVFSFGVGYTSQESALVPKNVNSQYERYTLRINNEYTVFKGEGHNILKVGENLHYNFVQKTGLGMATGGQTGNDIYWALTTSPFMPAYTESGDFHGPVGWAPQAKNPLANLYYDRSQGVSKRHGLRGNIYAVLEPVKNLTYRTSFGINMSASSNRSYQMANYISANQYRYKKDEKISQDMSVGTNWVFENMLTYDLALSESHHFNVMAGMTAEKSGLGENVGASNVNPIFDDMDHAYLGNTPAVLVGGTSYSGSPWGKSSLVSYFGRINYDFQEKYMATVVMRADGSSNFARGHRWGYFPSISAGWILTNENFAESIRGWADYLKIRASWGQNGNQSITGFQYVAPISFDLADYFFGPDKSVRALGAYPNRLANPDVKWETSEQLNFGVDARFLKSRLGLTLDLYNKTTKDWLVQAPVLASYGADAPYINGGDVRNKGVELALTWDDKISDFRYGVNANVSYNKNEVLRIANSEGVIHGAKNVLSQGTDEMYRAQVGYPIGYFYGYKSDGIFQNEDEVRAYVNSKGEMLLPEARPGDIRFVDYDNDGVITVDDRTMIGNPHPDVLFGFSLNLGYKGFDLSVVTSGMLGNQIAKSYREFAASPLHNYTKDILDRWHGEGTSNKIPKLTASTDISHQYISSLYLENGDYWRINNIILGYDFKRLLKSIPCEQVRLYISLQNPYTFTKYSGMDPEIGYGDGKGWVSGIDVGNFPGTRTFFIGCNLKF